MSAEIKFAYWPVSKLKAQTKINPRNHTAKHVADLAAVIERYGFRIPILVDRGGRVIAGHRRLLAAQQLKLKRVPVVMASDLDDDAQRAFMIVDNKVARLTQKEAWDDAKLAKAIKYLEQRGYAPESLAFTDDDVTRLTDDLEERRADENSHGADRARAPEHDDGEPEESAKPEQLVTLSIPMTPEQRADIDEAITARLAMKPKRKMRADALHAICVEWLRAQRKRPSRR